MLAPVPWRVVWRFIACLALAAAGCAGADAPVSEDTTYPLVASSDLALGQDRVLVALYDGETRPVASPELPVSLELFPPVGEPVMVPADFLWTIPGEKGVYAASVELESVGDWLVVVHPEDLPPSDPAPFQVLEEPATPRLGEPAPASDSLTTEDAPLAQITTDPEPDPRFYELSIAEAIRSGHPTVVVFSTPRFCTTRVCGPTLDLVKAEAPKYPEVNFVHVEIYDLDRVPLDLEPVPAVLEWGLPSEPWVFVVDPDGTITGRFEGTVSAEELAAALGA